MRPALLVTIVCAASVSALAQARVSLLAVDQGSYLQPIARLEGGHWVAVPAGLGQLAPRDWTRFYTLGSSVPVRLGIAEPTGRCATPRRLPIATPAAPDAAAKVPPRAIDSVYVGLSATGTVAVEPLRAVAAGAPEWSELTAAIGRIFTQRESQHGVAATTLSRVPMTVDHAYAAGPNRRDATYYFEASKRVPDAGNTPEEDPKGIVRVVVSGWLSGSAGGLTPAGTKGELAWEPAESTVPAAPVLSPLGVVRQRGERLWVMRAADGMRDRFTVYALGATTVRALFTVDAGGC